ncbi:MAG: hypothetical protein WKF97_10625 [Chitinophagaceae bacterium]
MKQGKLALGIIILAACSACSGGGSKKVLIMASGKLTVNESDSKNIKLEPGNTHNEKEIVVDGGDKQTLTVQSPDGDKTYEVNEAGHYVLNLKRDTLIGGLVRYGSTGMATNLSGEQVDHIIDSTQKLMLGQNASDESKSYFIAPFSIKKLSANADSKILGPYNGIPSSIDVDASGKGPEMYKLFTNKQKRETLEELIRQRSK